MTITHRLSFLAPVIGLLLGALDFIWIKYVPFPFGGLGNSIATWAVAAFLLTFWVHRPLVRASAGAVTMLVVAVPSYYVAAALIQHDNWSNAWNLTTRVWMVFAVVAGVVFGIGGVLARRPGRLRLPALGLPAADLLAEMLMDLTRIGDPNYETADTVEYAVVLAALAALITAAVARTGRDRALALACAAPLAGGGWVLMRAAGLLG